LVLQGNSDVEGYIFISIIDQDEVILDQMSVPLTFL